MCVPRSRRPLNTNASIRRLTRASPVLIINWKFQCFVVEKYVEERGARNAPIPVVRDKSKIMLGTIMPIIP